MRLSTQLTTRIFVSAIILLTLFTTSCKSKRVIKYPVSFNYGENLLLISNDSIQAGEGYSFEAELTKKCNLKIIITNLSADPSQARWNYDSDNITGWTLGNYAGGSQEFTTIKPGNSDMKMVFVGTNGKCRLDFYENSSEISKTKTFMW